MIRNASVKHLYSYYTMFMLERGQKVQEQNSSQRLLLLCFLALRTLGLEQKYFVIKKGIGGYSMTTWTIRGGR